VLTQGDTALLQRLRVKLRPLTLQPGRAGLCTATCSPFPLFSLLSYNVAMVHPPAEQQGDWKAGRDMKNVNGIYFRGFRFQ